MTAAEEQSHDDVKEEIMSLMRTGSLEMQGNHGHELSSNPKIVHIVEHG